MVFSLFLFHNQNLCLILCVLMTFCLKTLSVVHLQYKTGLITFRQSHSDLQAAQYNHSLIHWPLSSCTGAAVVKGLAQGHLRGFLIPDCDRSVLHNVHHLLHLLFGAGQIFFFFRFAKTSCLLPLDTNQKSLETESEQFG